MFNGHHFDFNNLVSKKVTILVFFTCLVLFADFKYMKSFDTVVGSPEAISERFFSSLLEGLKGLSNTNWMRGNLDRNVPTSSNKRLPPAPEPNAPAAKRTHMAKHRLGN